MTTYGELMDKSMAELAAAIAAPIRFSNVDPYNVDRTLFVLRGRARLYRGLAGALRTTRARTPRHDEDPVASQAITNLYYEVSASAAAVGTILADPGPRRLPWDAQRLRGMPHKLMRAADLAGGAWDLAATYLLPPGRRRTPDMTVEAVQTLTRQVQIDAAEIAAALANLDARLAGKLAVWTYHRPPGAPGHFIAMTLDDIAWTSQGQAAQYAATYLAATRDPIGGRAHHVQTLRTFPAPAPRSVRSPRAGTEAMRLLRQRLHDDCGTITTFDLANVAAACHRVALLTARAARDQPQPDETLYNHAVAAAGHWRRLAMALRDVKPSARPPTMPRWPSPSPAGPPDTSGPTTPSRW